MDDTNSKIEEFTRLELFLDEIQKTGTSGSIGSVHSVTVRIPTIEFATIEALSRSSGLARNKVIVKLLQIALDDVWDGVMPDTHDVISKLQAEIVVDLVADSEGNPKALDNASSGEI